MEDDILPIENQYYVFNVRERVEDGSYTASGTNTTVLINDVDLEKATDKGNANTIDQDSISQENSTEKVRDTLKESNIYQTYQDAYANQILFDPNR
jgi:hypothetical protein